MFFSFKFCVPGFALEEPAAESRRAASVAPMLSVVDETDDDWQAITALGSWAEFDAFFAEKYIDSARRSARAVGGARRLAGRWAGRAERPPRV